jgi:hypothetical protein
MFVNLLMEGTDPTTDATKAQLTAWVTSLNVPFTAARDPDSAPLAILHGFGERETTYVVERATMKILAVTSDPPNGLQTIQNLP